MLFTLIQSQVAWFAAVLLAAHGRPVAAAIAALALTVIQIGRAACLAATVRAVLAAAILGAIGDTLLARAHLLIFNGGTLIPDGSPLWMAALWMNFATVLSHSLRALHGRPLLAGVLGALGGPLAYAGGARFGALSLSGPTAIAAVGLEWLIAMPLLCAIANHRLAESTDTGRTR